MIPNAATDTFLGFGGNGSGVPATLAYMIVHMGDFMALTGNDEVKATTDVYQLSVQQSQYVHMGYWRRQGNYTQFDPDRDLEELDIPVPKGAGCDTKYTVCTPGPCLVWEYDYQYGGLQEASLRGMENVVPVNDTSSIYHQYYNEVYDQYPAANFSLGNATPIFPMVGIPRCGPLFNYQYTKVEHVNGHKFNAVEKTVPKDKDITHETYEFLPSSVDPQKVYPIFNQSMVPVAGGVNLNPMWYYEGYNDCYNEWGRKLHGKEQCSNDQSNTMVVNYLYNANPGPLLCYKKKPPPFAPGHTSDVNKLINPLNIPTDVTANMTHPAPNPVPSIWGNPRMQHMYSGDGNTEDTHTLLTGYVRGYEDDYIDGAQDQQKYKRYTSLGETRDPIYLGTSHTQGETTGKRFSDSGLGINHGITAQENPDVYQQAYCDFTQCRWVPHVNDQWLPNGVVGLFTQYPAVKHPYQYRPQFPYATASAYACLTLELNRDPEEWECPEHMRSDNSNDNDKEIGLCHTEHSNLRRSKMRCYGKRTLLPKSSDLSVELDPYLMMGSTNSLSENCTNEICIISNDGTTVGHQNALVARANDTAYPCLNSGHSHDDMWPNNTIYCGHIKTNISQAGIFPNCHVPRTNCDKRKDASFIVGLNRAGCIHRGVDTKSWEKAIGYAFKYDGLHMYDDSLNYSACDALYARTSHMEILYPGAKTIYNINGDKRYSTSNTDKCDYQSMLDHNSEKLNLSWGGCRNMPKIVAHWDDVNIRGTEHKLPGYFMQWSRGAIYSGDQEYDAHPNSHKTKNWQPPGLAEMVCADDRDTAVFDLKDTFGKESTFSREGRQAKYHLDTNNITDWSEHKKIEDLQMSVLLALHKRNERDKRDEKKNKGGVRQRSIKKSGYKPRVYKPLLSYYQETRTAFPKFTKSRLATWTNEHQYSEPFACDCAKIDIEWDYMDVPQGHANSIPTALTTLMKTYSSSRLLIAAYSWSKLRVTSTPVIGLYLPSSQSKVFMVERDIFKDVTPADSDSQRDFVTAYIDGANSPRETEMENLILRGERYLDKSNMKTQVDNDFAHRYTYEFNQGSCMRWPYGQVPQMAFNDPVQASQYWPGGKTTFGVEAMQGYCEGVAGTEDSEGVTKFQHCSNDRLSASDRHKFCNRTTSMASTHVVWAIGLSSRRVDDVCSFNPEHRVCLFIPGSPPHRTLSSLMHQLGNRAANMTILVLPLNYSVVEPFFGPSRHAGYVGGGIAWDDPNWAQPVTNAATKLTGIATDSEVYSMLDKTQHTVEKTTELVSTLLDLLLGGNISIAGCAANEYAVPSLGGAMHHMRCLSFSDVFYPMDDANIRVAHNNINITSAIASFDGIPTPMKFTRNIRVRKTDSDRSCTQFEISGANVTIGHMETNLTRCDNMNEFKRAPVVAAGRSVYNLNVSHLHVVANTGQAGVIFAGDDTQFSKYHRDVNVTNSYVKVTGNVSYTAAYARAYGNNIQAFCEKGTDCDLLIFPTSKDNLTFANPPEITNITRYTSVFGNGFMHRLYTPPTSHAGLAIVIFVLQLTTAFFLTLSLVLNADRNNSEAKRKMAILGLNKCVSKTLWSVATAAYLIRHMAAQGLSVTGDDSGTCKTSLKMHFTSQKTQESIETLFTSNTSSTKTHHVESYQIEEVHVKYQ